MLNSFANGLVDLTTTFRNFHQVLIGYFINPSAIYLSYPSVSTVSWLHVKFSPDKKADKGFKIREKKNQKKIMVNMETNSDERKIIDRVLHRDMVFRYQLLGRLQADCEYYLNYGNRNIRRLWAGNVNLQIKLMAELYNSFKEDEKPEWITMNEIVAYGKAMSEGE